MRRRKALYFSWNDAMSNGNSGMNCPVASQWAVHFHAFYSIANSFRKALETVLTNSPECAKSDCKSWRGRIENSFNKLAAGI